jgi:hypothetical protein
MTALPPGPQAAAQKALRSRNLQRAIMSALPRFLD